jgi:cell shape-determining protein MreC
LALLLGGFLLIGLPAALPWSQPLRSAVVTVAMPLVHAGTAVRDTVGSLFGGFGNSAHLAQENEALRAEMAVLRTRLAAIQMELTQAGDGAELQQALPEHAPMSVSARVLSTVIDGVHRRLWISVPDGATVFPGQVVLGPAGVLGTVREIHGRDALVQLLSDGDSRWGAEVSEREEVGVLHGTGSHGIAEFRPEKTSTALAEGDVLVTSGRRGSTIPAGLPIGTVTEVSTDYRGERRAVLHLAEPGESLRTVFLLNARQIPWSPPR